MNRMHDKLQKCIVNVNIHINVKSLEINTPTSLTKGFFQGNEFCIIFSFTMTYMRFSVKQNFTKYENSHHVEYGMYFM